MNSIAGEKKSIPEKGADMWKDTIKNRRQAEEYMEKLRAGGIVLGLDSMRRLAAAMGNPQDELRFIHIAGTNGKGSLLAFLSRILLLFKIYSVESASLILRRLSVCKCSAIFRWISSASRRLPSALP